MTETNKEFSVGVVDGPLVQEMKQKKLDGRIVGISYDGEDLMDFIQFITVSEKHFTAAKDEKDHQDKLILMSHSIAAFKFASVDAYDLKLNVDAYGVNKR